MKAPDVVSTSAYRPLLGILALVLLSLPAHAAWKPLAAMPTARSNAAMESINGIVYVAGGYNAGGTSTLLSFNPTTNAWTTLANMPITLYQGNGAGVINSQLYVSGGWNGPLPTSTLFMYDPPSNSWTTMAGMSHLSACGGTAVINSQLYVSGGWNGPLPTSTLFMYDPPSNSWTTMAGMSHLSACGGTAVINSKLYVTTACNGYSGYRSEE